MSTLPCEKGSSRRESLLDCDEEQAREQLLSLVAQRHGEAPVLSRATTTEEGSFSLEGLEAGPYTLWVESAQGTGLRHDVPAGSEGVELQLGAGTRLSGRVVDEAEAPVPIPGALVTAIFKPHSRFFEAVSDGEGRFQLGPMPPGEYTLITSKEGWLSSVTGLTGYAPEEELTTTLYRPRRVTGRVLRSGTPVAGAEVVVQDPPLEPILKTLTDTEGRFSFEGLPPLRRKVIATHGGEGAFLEVVTDELNTLEFERRYTNVTLELAPVSYVRGVVLDELRRPIEGASIEAQQDPEMGFIWMRGRTDAQGRYRLGPVKPGLVRFEVRADKHDVLLDQMHTVPAGESAVDFTLPQEVLVEGTVVDAAGQPVAGEQVMLRALDDLGNPRMWESSGETGLDGRFSLEASRAGSYRLEVSGRMTVPQAVEVVAPSTQRILAERLTTILEGEVVDEAGIPLPGVSVSLWTVTSGELEDYLVRGTFSDLQGRFSLTAPEEGRYRVVAGQMQGVFSRETSQVVEVGKGGARVRLRFAAAHRLSGVVVDRRGQPIADANVRVQPAFHKMEISCGGSTPGTRTDSDGRFTFRGVSGELLRLHVWKEGFGRAEGAGPQGSIPLSPDAREVRVVLVDPAVVKGRFVHEDGSPVTHFSVNGESYEDKEGRFAHPLDRLGTVLIELYLPESPHESVRRTVTIHQEEVEVDLGTITFKPEE
ncbi:carboxypeptidase regulatory-like domain-containing protein [Archangium violaceum]|uniref:carboxypeptidase regulatory-like domain-containing protein n=1 Tax=Archangium violaceum TaxID=83451 RepID=UPI0037C19FDA